MEFTKYGTIKGGVCEKIHKGRSEREAGARLYLSRLEESRGIKWVRGWGRIVKTLRIPRRQVWKIGARLGGEVEVGWYRFEMDIAIPLCKSGKAFRKNSLDKWIDTACGYQFWKGKVHQGEIYQAKKAAGEFQANVPVVLE